MERKNVFNSTTAMVKDLIMDYVWAAGKEVERKELVAYINENMGYNERLTDGVIAGAIKILINSGELQTVRRGCYAKGAGKESVTVFERICGVCERFETDLNKACTVNLMELTDKEKENYVEFTRILEDSKDYMKFVVYRLKDVVDKTLEEEGLEYIGDIDDFPPLPLLEDKGLGDSSLDEVEAVFPVEEAEMEMAGTEIPVEDTPVEVEASAGEEEVQVEMVATPEEVNEAVEEVTGTPEEVVATPEEVNEAVEEVTGTPEEVTETVEEVAGTPEEVIGTVESEGASNENMGTPVEEVKTSEEKKTTGKRGRRAKKED